MTGKKPPFAANEGSAPSFSRPPGPLLWIFGVLVVLGLTGFSGGIILLVPLFTKAGISNAPQPALPALPITRPPASGTGDFDSRMATAAAMQAREDYAGALVAFADLSRDFPANPKPVERMEMIAALLRSNGFAMTPAKFAALRTALEKAAGSGVVSAQMLLGEQLRSTSPPDSLRYFKEAARSGQTEAMTQAGLMLSNGRGTSAPDLQLAVGWFERASAAGDDDAMTALAECLIYGKGIQKNLPRAVELLQKAAALHHPLALNLLGDLYARGTGVPQNFPQAYKLFSQSAAQGFGDGIANVGALTMRGEGTPADPGKAIAIWKAGIDRGFPSCMVNYAKALESGQGIPADPSLARHWYVRAARGGNEEAIQWCREHKTAF